MGLYNQAIALKNWKLIYAPNEEFYINRFKYDEKSTLGL